MRAPVPSPATDLRRAEADATQAAGAAINKALRPLAPDHGLAHRARGVAAATIHQGGSVQAAVDAGLASVRGR